MILYYVHPDIIIASYGRILIAGLIQSDNSTELGIVLEMIMPRAVYEVVWPVQTGCTGFQASSYCACTSKLNIICSVKEVVKYH